MIFDFNVKITVTDAPVSIELNKELVEIEEGGEVMRLTLNNHSVQEQTCQSKLLLVAILLKVEPFECSSEARPPASIVWTIDGKEIAEGKQLSLSGPVSR